MMKFTRPSALHAMGATIDQLRAYAMEIGNFICAYDKKTEPKGNENDPEKKSRSRSRKAKKEKKEETEDTEETEK